PAAALLARSSSRTWSAAGQIPVHEHDRHCAFAHGGCAALDRAMADVAGSEKTGDVGFEVVRWAVEWPSVGPLVVSQEIRPSHEIACFIACHAGLHGPLRSRGAADTHEHPVRLDPAAGAGLAVG